jgi:hypothetical protein
MMAYMSRATITSELYLIGPCLLQGRAYRIGELFVYLEFNMSVSLLATTLARNFGVSGTRRGAWPGGAAGRLMLLACQVAETAAQHAATTCMRLLEHAARHQPLMRCLEPAVRGSGDAHSGLRAVLHSEAGQF